MVLVSKELRWHALLPTDRTVSIAEVVAVKEEGKSRQSLEVRVRFEASRIERDCLASAYERVAPNRRRVLMRSETRSRIVRAPMLQCVGGVVK